MRKLNGARPSLFRQRGLEAIELALVLGLLLGGAALSLLLTGGIGTKATSRCLESTLTEQRSQERSTPAPAGPLSCAPTATR